MTVRRVATCWRHTYSWILRPLVSDLTYTTEDASPEPSHLLSDVFEPVYLFRIAALAALYYGSARLGFALEFAGPVAAIVWLPVGVGIASLYLFGLRLWPGVLIGDLLANNYGAIPLAVNLGQTAGNLLEIVVATILLRRLTRGRPPLATVGNLAWMVTAFAVGTLVSATVGSICLRLNGVIDDRRDAQRLADVVARRRHRRPGGRAARARLALPTDAGRVAGPADRGRGRAGGGGRADRARAARRPPADLHRVPGADPGGAALRPARRDARHRHRRRADGVEHDATPTGPSTSTRSPGACSAPSCSSPSRPCRR